MLYGDRMLYSTAAVTVLFILSCLAQSQNEKFAGNLIQEDEVEQPLSQASRDAAHVSSSQDSNVTTVDEVVHVVPSPDLHDPSSDDPSPEDVRDYSPEDVRDPSPEEVHDAEDSGPPAQKKKAPRPVKKPESIGFVSPPEEEPLGQTAQEEAIERIEEKQVVRLIPTLPPRFAMVYYLCRGFMQLDCLICSIIKPGRMLNGSWFIVVSFDHFYHRHVLHVQ